MVCILCYGYLFGSLVRDIPSASKISRVAALACGHTFHLECITMCLNNAVNARCPVCNAPHAGSILTLHIECDRDHIANDKHTYGDPLGEAKRLCNPSLDSAEQQEVRFKRLEAKTAALQMELDEKAKPLKEIQAKLKGLYKKVAFLEGQEKELSTLAERHKVNIQGLQGALELKNRTIARLKKRISEQEAEPEPVA
ncbi:hypothetical protein IWW37_002462 [Coemansia sp. RSA 2050]|nr:hypothetical protein IWW37_002462 [Coemansia sp. RSA 2050]KAJ2734221.1 hypothetical protein IW152_002460 [Coemansia sp. BCRC 34962]